MHKHHIIPKSRGGTDEDWNILEIDEISHAYEHALDFVLFDHSPRFDFRHVGWPFLPNELQNLVKEKHAKLFKEQMTGRESPIKGKVRAYNPDSGEDGFYHKPPESFVRGVPKHKRRPKGLRPGCTRKDLDFWETELLLWYEAGLSTSELAVVFKTNHRTIAHRIKLAGGTLRSKARGKDLKPRKKEGYFKKGHAQNH